MFRKSFLILIMLFLLRINNSAIDITATGGWTRTITSSDLISGAGSNLINSYQSSSNATIINILNCINNNDRWRVDISRTDNIWNSNFILSVRRTSSGTGGGAINGGTVYMQITTVSQRFFMGRGNRSNINVQYRLNGMSINVAPNIYSTTVTYTLVDT